MDGTQTGGAPNHFELEGDGVRVTFDTTSITGRPLLSYADANTSAQFAGDELRIEQGGLGTLVTVGVGPFVDASNTTFTLVVPGFAPAPDGPCAVATFGVLTEHRLAAGTPGAGQLDSYRTVAMTGTASLVAS
jgi:hypothetical protein